MSKKLTEKELLADVAKAQGRSVRAVTREWRAMKKVLANTKTLTRSSEPAPIFRTPFERQREIECELEELTGEEWTTVHEKPPGPRNRAERRKANKR